MLTHLLTSTAAEYIGIPYRHLTRLSDKQIIPCERSSTGRRRYRIADLDAYLATNPKPPVIVKHSKGDDLTAKAVSELLHVGDTTIRAWRDSGWLDDCKADAPNMFSRKKLLKRFPELASGELITLYDAAALAGVAASTIRRHAAAGKIRVVPTLGGRGRYYRSEIEQIRKR